VSDNKAHRRTWEGREAPLREMPLFGWGDHMRVMDHDLAPHSHDSMEVTLFVRGGVEWWVDREVHSIHRGEVFVTRAGEVHGGVDSQLQRCEIFWLQVRLPLLERARGPAGRESRRLARAISGIRCRCFPASEELESMFRRIYEEMKRPRAIHELVLRTSLFSLLVQLLEDHDRAVASDEARGPRVSERIARSLAWIESHVSEEFRVEEAAAAVGMSVSWFHEVFLAEVGYSPGDYRHRVRVRRAKELLQGTDWPVTKIAMELGFTTSQYFATAFRKASGVGPREYRLRAKKAAQTGRTRGAGD